MFYDEQNPENAPKCVDCGVNSASYDSESGGYFSACEECSFKVGRVRHLHHERYWPEYLSANPHVDPKHTWQTSYPCRPHYSERNGVQTGWLCTRCGTILPLDSPLTVDDGNVFIGGEIVGKVDND